MVDIKKIHGCIRKSINTLIDNKILEADKTDYRITTKEYTKGFPIIEMRMPPYYDQPLSYEKLEQIVQETNDCIVDTEIYAYKDDLFIIFTPRQFNE